MPPLPTPRPASSHKDPHARLPSTGAGSQLGVPSWEEKNGRDPLGQKLSQNPRQSNRCEQPPHFTIGEMVPLRGSPKRPLQEPSPMSNSKSEVMTPVGPKPQTPAGSSALGRSAEPHSSGDSGRGQGEGDRWGSQKNYLDNGPSRGPGGVTKRLIIRLPQLGIQKNLSPPGSEAPFPSSALYL